MGGITLIFASGNRDFRTVQDPTVNGSAYVKGEYQSITALMSSDVIDVGLNACIHQ
jgi:hypothetical protein